MTYDRDEWEREYQELRDRRARLEQAIRDELDTGFVRASRWGGYLTVTRSTYPGVLYQVTRWSDDWEPEGHTDARSIESAAASVAAYGGDPPPAVEADADDELTPNPARTPDELPEGWYVKARYSSHDHITVSLRTGDADIPGDRRQGWLVTAYNKDCNAYYVDAAQAPHGWGPLLYDLAMELATIDGTLGLHCDDYEISAAAKKVWRHYLERSESGFCRSPEVLVTKLPKECWGHFSGTRFQPRKYAFRTIDGRTPVLDRLRALGRIQEINEDVAVEDGYTPNTSDADRYRRVLKQYGYPVAHWTMAILEPDALRGIGLDAEWQDRRYRGGEKFASMHSLLQDYVGPFNLTGGRTPEGAMKDVLKIWEHDDVPLRCARIIAWVAALVNRWLKAEARGDLPVRHYMMGYAKTSTLENAYELRDSADAICDWVSATRPDLSRMTFEDAMHEQIEWHEEMQRQAEARADAPPPNGEIVLDWDDGWTAHALTEKEELETEGCVQGHCVGTASHLDPVLRGDAVIVSLRRPDGMPVLTLELGFRVDPTLSRGEGNTWVMDAPAIRSGEPILQEVKGWGNRLPGTAGKRFDASECRRLGELLDWLEVGEVRTSDVHTHGCLTDVVRVFEERHVHPPDGLMPGDWRTSDEAAEELDDDQPDLTDYSPNTSDVERYRKVLKQYGYYVLDWTLAILGSRMGYAVGTWLNDVEKPKYQKTPASLHSLMDDVRASFERGRRDTVQEWWQLEFGDWQHPPSDCPAMIPWVASLVNRWLKQEQAGSVRAITSTVGYRMLETIASAWELRAKADGICDWVVATRPNLMAMSIAEAIHAQEAWHEEMRRRATEYAPPPGEVVYQWHDGWTVQKLTTKKQLDAEGCSQGHCVGSYYNQVQRGDIEIVSLRRPDGRPVLTIELQALDPEYHGYGRPGDAPRRSLLQAKGWGNRTAGEHGKRYDESECARLAEIMVELNVRQGIGDDLARCTPAIHSAYDAAGRRHPELIGHDPAHLHYDEDGLPIEGE